MTAPMFLDAPGLRELSQRVREVRMRGSVEEEMTVARASVELNEASRRLDALSAVTVERDECQALHEETRVMLDKALTERDQARQVLADAPHGTGCNFRTWMGTKCDCWKAGL